MAADSVDERALRDPRGFARSAGELLQFDESGWQPPWAIFAGWAGVHSGREVERFLPVGLRCAQPNLPELFVGRADPGFIRGRATCSRGRISPSPARSREPPFATPSVTHSLHAMKGCVSLAATSGYADVTRRCAPWHLHRTVRPLHPDPSNASANRPRSRATSRCSVASARGGFRPGNSGTRWECPAAAAR